MKALAEQISELDGVTIYRRYRRVVGVRGLMVEVAGAAACDVGRRAGRDRDRAGGVPSGARSPAFLPSWWTATTTTNGSPTPSAAFSIHIVMEHVIAERGRYPAINVLKSVSRMPRAADHAYLPALARARQVMATYADMEELIRLGACRAGTSPEVDEAIRCTSRSKLFLAQSKEEATSLAEGYRRLAEIVAVSETER
jgi:hypothetical protein